MAPIVLELTKYPDLITPIVTVTAQHRDMLDQVLGLFQIKPDHDLDIMAAGQTLFDITTKAMMGLDKVLSEEKPDIVLVHGDNNDLCWSFGSILSLDNSWTCGSGSSNS